MRVLEVFGEPISNGGQESFVINLIQHMDRTDMQIDLLTPYYCDNEHYKSLVADMGGTIYDFNLPFSPGNSRFDIVKPLKEFLKKNRYDVVHIHSGSISVLCIVAALAKRNGVKRIITHSHCAAEHKNLKHKLVKFCSLPFMKLCPTDYCACSQIAGDWKYSKRIANSKLIILKNGVDLNKFSYKQEVRDAIRKQLNLESDAFVLGNVGRFSYQKNQLFLLEIFAEFRKLTENAKLMLIGHGEDAEAIHEKVKSLGLEDSVVFCGLVNNVNDYMQAMDVFVLPSRYEGLPIVGVEAQAAGLPVITSTNVSEELKLTDHVEYISLEKTAKEWATEIAKYVDVKRADNAEALTSCGYDVDQTADMARTMYFS